jgi:hypothetical protein
MGIHMVGDGVSELIGRAHLIYNLAIKPQGVSA